MVDNQAMFEKKKALAEKLLKKDILIIYTDRSPSIFVAEDNMSSDEVAILINEAGFELSDKPDAGYFATVKMKENGYWCNLK